MARKQKVTKAKRFPLMTKAEKREKARLLMISGQSKLPLPLFEAHHPELVRTDSVERISPLGLKYRTGKYLDFEDTVKNFSEHFEELCKGQALEDCIEGEVRSDFADHCLFNSKPCVKDQAIKKLRKKYEDAEKGFDPYSDLPDSYWEELNRQNQYEEIPF